MEKPQPSSSASGQFETISASYEVPVTPDQLMIAARNLELAARTACPGQKIYMRVTPNIIFTYNPRITSNDMAIRSHTRLPGTELTQLIDRKIAEDVATDEAQISVNSMP